MGYYTKPVSAIYNDVMSGLRGYSSNPTMSIEQLEDDYIDERLQVIKEYSLQGLLPVKDLLLSINCIKVDCESLERCRCDAELCTELVAHFEMPQLLNDFGELAIEYIGSTDRRNPFLVYTTHTSLLSQKYKKRGKKKPYVWIDTTPNSNNMYDAFIFNAPLIKEVSVVAVFKDPRQLDDYGCCDDLEVHNMSFIDNEVKRRLTEKKLRFYRQFLATQLPNDQIPK